MGRKSSRNRNDDASNRDLMNVQWVTANRQSREASQRDTPERDRLRAQGVLERVLRQHCTESVVLEIGLAEFLSRGLSAAVFRADVEASPDEALSGAYIVRLPYEASAELSERFRREEKLLSALSERELRFRIPSVMGFEPDGDVMAMVQRLVVGLPLEPDQKPWKVSGEVAAAIHCVEPAGLPLEGHATRAEHAVQVLSSLENSGDTLVEEVYQWGMTHLPPATPVCLIHGDLLGQNLLVVPDMFTDEPIPTGVIDWEYAMLGDPAYDLAILTRGMRRPFHVADGFERLLSCYLEAGGGPVTANEVRLYELAFVAEWTLDLLAEKPHEAEPRREQLRRLLALVGAR